MEVLDIQLSVSDHPQLTADVKNDLMAMDAFEPLAHGTQTKLLSGLAPSGWLTAEVANSAVFVADDWTVSIHGKKLIHSFYAAMILTNSLGEILKSPVSVNLMIARNFNQEPLDVMLKKRLRNDRVLTVMKWSATIIASGIASVAIDRMIL